MTRQQKRSLTSSKNKKQKAKLEASKRNATVNTQHTRMVTPHKLQNASTGSKSEYTRKTITEKLRYVELFEAYQQQGQGNQKSFCDKYDLWESTFSKWRRKKSQLQEAKQTNSKNKNHFTKYSTYKEKIIKWMMTQAKCGVQVTVPRIMEFAKCNTPLIFKNHQKNYSNRYTICKRLLLKKMPEIQKLEEVFVSNALMELSHAQPEALPTVDVSDMYTPIETVNYNKTRFVEESMFGYCECKGMNVVFVPNQ